MVKKMCLPSPCLFIFRSRIYLQTLALNPLHPRTDFLVGYTLAVCQSQMIFLTREGLSLTFLFVPSTSSRLLIALLCAGYSAKCFVCIISLNPMKQTMRLSSFKKEEPESQRRKALCAKSQGIPTQFCVTDPASASSCSEPLPEPGSFLILNQQFSNEINKLEKNPTFFSKVRSSNTCSFYKIKISGIPPSSPTS